MCLCTYILKIWNGSPLAVGFYLTTKSAQKVQLHTPVYDAYTVHCARFWWVSHMHLLSLLWSCGMIAVSFDVCRYWLPEGPSNILTVHVKGSGGLGEALWRTSGLPSTGWEVAEVTVSYSGKFNVCINQWNSPNITQSNCTLPGCMLSYASCHSPGGVSSSPRVTRV